MEVKCNNYEVKDIVRFMRESTDKTQAQFSKQVGHKRGWCAKIESGVTKMTLNDFFKLAELNDIEIIMKKK